MRKIYLIVLTAVILLCAARCAYALEFSADMVSTSSEGSMRGKAYVSDIGARIEMPGVGATITRTDRKVVWVLMDRERMYMEQAFDPKTAASMKDKVDGEIERTYLGNEIIGGRPAKKYRVVADEYGGRMEMYQWMDDATGIPLRTEAANGEWSVEYRNLQAGRQDPALFEIPAGYKKFAMPSMDDIKAMAAQYGSGYGD